MKKFKLFQTIGFAALLAALLFASCEQEAFTPVNLTGEPAALNAAVNIAPKLTVPPDVWVPFAPPPFSNTYQVRALVAKDSYLVAATLAGGTASAARFDTRYGWTDLIALPDLGTANPSASFYLNCYYLVTAGSNVTAGNFSSDGVTWYPTGTIGFGTKAGLYGPDEQLYVVAGQNGQAAFTEKLDAPFNQISNTTTGWINGSGPEVYINAGAYGAKRYVFGGGSGRIAYTDLIKPLTPWMTANEPFENEDFVNAIAYGGDDTFVAVGNTAKNTGIIAFSTNRGEDWEPANTSASPNVLNDGIFALTYNDGFFVAVNDSGYAAYSKDGINWYDSPKSPAPVGAGSRFNAVTFYPGTFTFVTGGSDSNGMLLFTSRYP
jgi:hypothetical protein